jgi:hypothetical protein
MKKVKEPKARCVYAHSLQLKQFAHKVKTDKRRIREAKVADRELRKAMETYQKSL